MWNMSHYDEMKGYEGLISKYAIDARGQPFAVGGSQNSAFARIVYRAVEGSVG